MYNYMQIVFAVGNGSQPPEFQQIEKGKCHAFLERALEVPAAPQILHLN